MSDYEILKQKYESLIKETKELVHYKQEVKDLKEEIDKLNRIIKYRDNEINNLYMLLDKKIKFINETRNMGYRYGK